MSIQQLSRVVLAFCLAMAGQTALFASDLTDAQDDLLRGRYEECLEAADVQLERGYQAEAWYLLKAEAAFRLGRYAEALETLENGMKRFTWSIRLRCLALRVLPYTAKADQRKPLAEEVARLVQRSPVQYTDSDNLIALGQFVLSEGADAKRVQEAFFERARRAAPRRREPVLALGTLALSKRDFALAADIFRPALETFPDDPDLLAGLGLALAESDPERTAELFEAALRENPRQIEVLLARAERLIDAEQFDQADEQLDQILEFHATHPEALALKSVIATLQGDDVQAEGFRDAALACWSSNPLVDHVIGRKLSQRYRFAEGATAQARALEFVPDYLPAQKQLVLDLLRLGREAEGWRLAEEVHQRDQYDVATYNLVTLHDELQNFITLEADGLLVRMDALEAALYGERVMALLQEARTVLCEKYQLEPPAVVLVELFPKPADFAVRTFGLPVAGAYLGVCFGNVITANSPASRPGAPFNWESVLWHEFVHVVTLNKTHNRMPRWLSEGISVYEERLRNPTWGERMTPVYRDLILSGQATPVGELSSAFLDPQGNLLFAYYQSSMVVEYLIDEYGLETLLAVLDDLAVGMSIHDALARHTVPLAQLEEQFQTFLEQAARNFGPDVDWSSVSLEALLQQPDPAAELVAWAKGHPRNYRGLKQCADLLIKLNRPADALPILQQAVALFPHETGPESPSRKLADLFRQSGQSLQEYETLQAIVSRDDRAAEPLARLIERETEQGDWQAVRQYGLQLLSINPLIPAPHAALARAGEELGESELAIPALRSLLKTSPLDPADLHFRLARQLRDTEELTAARRHVLQSLEEAPRFRAALQLLRELHGPAAGEQGE